MTLRATIEYGEYGKILIIDAKNYPRLATIEDDPNVMALVIQKLQEEPLINTINIEQEEIISYYEDSVSILKQFSSLIPKIREITSALYSTFFTSNPLYYEYKKVIDLLDKNYLYDPIGTYISIKRLARKLEYLKSINEKLVPYINTLLSYVYIFINDFESLSLYKVIKDFIVGLKAGEREIYKRILLADIKPKFISIKYISKIPENAQILETYNVDKNTEVIIFTRPDTIQNFYYIFPEEYKLFEEDLMIINKAREILMQYQPRKEEYLDSERLKEVYKQIIRNIINNLARMYKVSLSKDKVPKIEDILLRYTIGFGILEKIALDENVQDIFVNPPPGLNPISLIHANYELCITNVIPTKRELESWATKLRLISGRPFDEANPVLDTEIFLQDVRLRVAAIMHPLSPKGLSYVFRRHRNKPWTLPLFIKYKMLNPLAAGLLSFLVENGRSILIAGTRGAGKTSLLTSLLLEIPRNSRIITIEDTLEIPVDYIRKLGYNIVSMKVRSPFSIQSSELSAEDGVRVSLRLGDSAIVLGEVRSKEAQTLYEAMRVGALANAVLGTIHAESPYGVYDRVVNDLGVPKTSFKATDIIVIANPIKDVTGTKKYRRVIKITEVRKHWEVDPLKEKGFVDLMSYDTTKDELKPTLSLLNGDSDILKSIASRVKILAGSWEKLWEYIELNSEAKQMLVKFADAKRRYDILEADFVIKANEKLRLIIKKQIEETGSFSKSNTLDEFKKWLYRTV